MATIKGQSVKVTFIALDNNGNRLDEKPSFAEAADVPGCRFVQGNVTVQDEVKEIDLRYLGNGGSHGSHA